MITAYDAPTARIADGAGADIILVGDSVANVVLGYDDTLSVTIDDMVHHTAAVSRTTPKALVVGDMPWMSYHVSVEETARNAGRLVREGGAGSVKLEGGRKRLPMISAVVDAEIPVMGHLGLTPQSVHAMGGYRVQGRDVAAAEELIVDARALDAAGVFAIVLGVGDDPKFVRRYAELAQDATKALSYFFSDVESGAFPSEDETYHMSEEAAAELLSGGQRSVD
jgi:3-methyl-2-oxobutanoate hydroxymethyltransferase